MIIDTLFLHYRKHRLTVKRVYMEKKKKKTIIFPPCSDGVTVIVVVGKS